MTRLHTVAREPRITVACADVATHDRSVGKVLLPLAAFTAQLTLGPDLLFSDLGAAVGRRAYFKPGDI
jgi:hypothetical protein